jgi:exportin-1
VPEFRNVTLKCLSEIGGLTIAPEYNEKFVTLFNVVMTSINRMVPPNTGQSTHLLLPIIRC